MIKFLLLGGYPTQVSRVYMFTYYFFNQRRCINIYIQSIHKYLSHRYNTEYIEVNSEKQLRN